MSTLRADETVKIPAAVLAATNAAESYYQSTETPVEKPEEGEISSENRASEVQNFSDDPPQVTEIANTPVTSEVTREDEGSWEHRYKSMKGRFDRSQSQIAQLSDQIQGLQNVISTLQSPKIGQKSDEISSTERFLTP